MLCQRLLAPGPSQTYAGAWYVPGQELWTATSTGLSMFIQNGQVCTGQWPQVTRATVVDFQCNTKAMIPFLRNVTETAHCYYRATVDTALVCAQKVPRSGDSRSPSPPFAGDTRSSLGVVICVTFAGLAAILVLLYVVGVAQRQQISQSETLSEAGVVWLRYDVEDYQQADAATKSTI